MERPGGSKSASGRPLVVVTGASSGIGRAASKLFAASGYDVVAVARSVDKLASLQQEAGPAVEVEAVDMADGDAATAWAQRVVARRGAPYAVVNSAGAGAWKYLEDTPLEEARAMLGAPFFAAVHASRAFLPSMLKAQRGVIIHVQSPAAVQPWAGATLYTASRFALRGLHEALAVDLVGTGVTSCEATFGEVESGYWDANPGSREHLPAIARLIPRMTPEQCAEHLLRVLRRPRRAVTAPFMVSILRVMQRWFPSIVLLLIARTGRRRP